MTTTTNTTQFETRAVSKEGGRHADSMAHAFAEIVQLAYDRLFWEAKGIVGAEEALDVVQEVLLVSWQKGTWKVQEPGALFEAWMASTRTLCKKIHQQSSRMGLNYIGVWDGEESEVEEEENRVSWYEVELAACSLLEQAENPVFAAVAALGPEGAAAVVSLLSDEHREVLMTRFMQGLSFNQTMKALNIGRNSLKIQLTRALESLRKLAREEALGMSLSAASLA
jgi:DNA-directed RNA polymerase specialized sigma24 family protein